MNMEGVDESPVKIASHPLSVTAPSTQSEIRFAESRRGEQSLVEISEDRLNLRDGGDPVLDGLYDHVGDDGWFASLPEDERRRLEAWSSGEGFEACFALTLLTIGMLAGNVRDNAAVRVVNR